MQKLVKTIFILAVVIFSSFYSVQTIGAISNLGLVVQVCKTQNNPADCTLLSGTNHASLFKELDILPGNTTNRWIKVTNLSGGQRQIAVAVNGHNSTCPSANGVLSDVLQLTIKENSSQLYRDSLTNFYTAGEKYLSPIESSSTNTYEFSVFFNPTARDNNYQGCTTNFNFDIGFWGESISQEITPPGSGGGGGAVFIAGLIISGENASPVQTNSVTINWQTNQDATSRVIYSAGSESHNLQWTIPPNYGYAHSTAENSDKSTGHSVTITGLSASTTYYFRCVSHASPDTISPEHTFTTLASQAGNGQSGSQQGGQQGNNTSTATGTAGQPGQKTAGQTNGGFNQGGSATSSQGGSNATSGEQGGVAQNAASGSGQRTVAQKTLNSLLAAIGSFWGNLNQSFILLFIVILCLIILSIICIREWILFYRRRKKEKK